MKRGWLGLTAALLFAGMSCGGAALPVGADVRKAEAAVLPRIWVVSVGVSKYAANEFKLAYADADAKSIDDIFAAPKGPVPEGRRTLLVNEKVNRASVLGALKEVGNRSAENDVIVLFMAMHGMKRENEPFYFMTHDTDPSNLMATGIRDTEVMETLKNANAKKHVVLIDACHAGGFGLDASLRALRAEATDEWMRGFQSIGSGTGVLAAAALNQYSEENERWGGGHGVFTYHLVEGLRQGAADENKDGVATLRELYDYVYDRVKKDRNGKQHPDFKGEGEIPLMAYDWTQEPTEVVGAPVSNSEAPEPARATKDAANEPAPTPHADDTLVKGMVQLPSGTFKMGQRGDTVTVSSFYMDITEVTGRAYAACVDAGKCENPDTGPSCNWGNIDRPDHPINCVDWDQANAYCKSKGKRLPTEEEWEWAARGTSRGTKYPWGNAKPAIPLLCQSIEKARRMSTCPVGSYPAGDSPQGIKDLAGNVAEWTASQYGSEFNRRVHRGGSWNLDNEQSLGASSRLHHPLLVERNAYLGFRCARSL